MMAYLLNWWNDTGTAASASAEPVQPVPSNNQQVDHPHEYARIPVDLELILASRICSQAEAIAI